MQPTMKEKGIHIKDIQPNASVRGIFLVKEKTLAVTRNGAPYLALSLADKTGAMEARVWERSEEWNELFRKGDYVAVEAQSESFRDKTQLNILRLEPHPANLVNAADFLPSSAHHPEEMWRELKSLAAGVKNRYLAQLLKAFFSDKSFRERFKVAPAAKRMHHAYLSGLLEHTLSVAKLVSGILKNYPELDESLLLTGGILHDIGKIREYTYPPEASCFDYTDEGRLVGHPVMGAEMVRQKVDTIPHFPKETAMLLQHLILSHHGEYESGSPKRPKTAEAFVLHLADDMDAKVNAIAGLKAGRSEDSAQWSAFFRPLERYIYFGGETALPDTEGSLEATPVPAEVKETAGEQYSLMDKLKGTGK